MAAKIDRIAQLLNCPEKGEEMRRAITETRKEFLLNQQEEDVLEEEDVFEEEVEEEDAEDEDYDTVSGFMMSELEKIPVAGDQVRIPAGFLTVTRMDGRRVDRVRFEPIEVEDE